MLVELKKIHNEFESSIDRVKKYIDTYASINGINIDFMRGSKFYKEAKSQLEDLQREFLETKIEKYNAIIISLYGCFELVIKKAIKAMIRHMLNKNIGEVEGLKRENLSSVIRALERSDSDVQASLIQGLYLLYYQKNMSGYNYDLSLNSYQNLKVNVIYNIAKIIGIKDLEQQIKCNPSVIDYVQAEQGLSDKNKAIEYIKSGVELFGEINSLVDSRNKIAHEGYEPNMLSDDIIKKNLIPKLNLFVATFIRILQLKYLELYKDQGNFYCELTLLNPVYNNHIICFNTGSNRIDKQSLILIDTGKKHTFAKISNIRIGKNDVVEASENCQVGCQLDINVKDSYKFYLFLGANAKD